MSNLTPRQAHGLLLLVIVIWGANWPVMKVGLDWIPPFAFAAWRVLLGSASLFALLALLGRLRPPPRADLPIVLSLGLIQVALILALVNTGLQVVPAGRSAVLAYTTPLWAAPLAALVLGERLTGMRIAGLLLGLSGLVVLFSPASFDATAPGALIGNGLLLLAALAWAGMLVHIRRHRWHASPLDLLPWQTLLGGIVLALASAVLESGRAIDWHPATVAVLVYNGPLASALCFWAYTSAARALPTLGMSMASLGVPVVGIVASVVALGEPIGAWDGLALGLVLAGILVVARAEAGGPRP